MRKYSTIHDGKMTVTQIGDIIFFVTDYLKIMSLDNLYRQEIRGKCASIYDKNMNVTWKGGVIFCHWFSENNVIKYSKCEIDRNISIFVTQIGGIYRLTKYLLIFNISWCLLNENMT